MPSAIRYVPPTSTERQAYDTTAFDEVHRRETAYKLALQYYKGVQDRQMDYPTDAEPIDDEVQINLVRMTADRTVSFLFPDIIEFVTDQESVEKTEHELFLDEFLKESGGLKTLIKWAVRGFLSGHTYTQVFRHKPYPRFAVLDPLSVIVFWRADDQADVLWYEMRYAVNGVGYIRDFVKVENDETGETSWDVTDYRQDKNAAFLNFQNQMTLHGRVDALQNFTHGDGYVVESPTRRFTYKHSPLQDTGHLPDPDSFYGINEFGPEKTLQDTINRLASVRNQIARENAEPVDFIAGVDVDHIETEGGVLSHPNEKAKPYRMEMKGDLAGITSSIDKLVETYLSLLRVVLLKGEAKDLQRVTNASVRTLFIDAVAKNGILRSAYGETLIKMAKVALLMGWQDGTIKEDPRDLKISIQWPQPLPEDMTEIANVIALAQAGGYMGKKTAAEWMRLDWNREQTSIKAEFAEDLERQKQTLTTEAETAIMINESEVNETLAPNEQPGGLP